MNVRSEIRTQIVNHLNRYDIVSNHVGDDIIDSVLAGNSAFQIIHDDFSITSWTILDRSLIKSMPGIDGGTIYSYDGGKRYQWFESETLLIDLKLLREYKLNEILR
jgi:hypothetical protein